MEQYALFIEPDVEYTPSGRPVYKKLSQTSLEKALNAISIILFVSLWTFTTISIINLPEEITVYIKEQSHTFNRLELTVPALVSSCLSIMLSLATYWPHKFNLSRQDITIMNASKIYRATRALFRYLTCVILAAGLALNVLWATAASKSEEISVLALALLFAGASLAIFQGVISYFRMVKSDKTTKPTVSSLMNLVG